MQSTPLLRCAWGGGGRVQFGDFALSKRMCQYMINVPNVCLALHASINIYPRLHCRKETATVGLFKLRHGRKPAKPEPTAFVLFDQH